MIYKATTWNDEFYDVIKDAIDLPTLEKVKNRVNRLLREESKMYCYSTNDNILGIIIINNSNNDKTIIELLGVKKNCRNNGIGKELMDYIKINNKRIIVETDISAVKFYNKMGFQEKEIQKEYPDGIVTRYLCEYIE
jgi:ribosomal protein S18 acetylase RimI-like enzyme